MRIFVLAATAVSILSASAAFTQEPGRGTALISNFFGTWAHVSLYPLEPPLSGPAGEKQVAPAHGTAGRRR